PCRTSPSCAERSVTHMIAMARAVVLLGFVFGLIALVAAPFVLALFLVGIVLRLVFFVLVLPFRLLKGVLLVAGFGFLLILGAIPLLPFLLIGAGIYLVFRGMRSRSAPVGHA